MSVSSLSESSQNYLKAVWGLSEWSHDPVTASTIATRVGVRLSTASDAIKKLTAQGLLEHSPYGDVKLTPEGRTLALAVVRRHRLLETFLVEVLGYTWDQVHEEAEHLEHSISDFMTESIDRLLNFPERDPHGDPIPRADGSITIPSAMLLSSLEIGQRARVERISDDDPTLLQFLADRGLIYGAVVEKHPSVPFSEACEVMVEETRTLLSLGAAASDSIWVAPLTSHP